MHTKILCSFSLVCSFHQWGLKKLLFYYVLLFSGLEGIFPKEVDKIFVGELVGSYEELKSNAMAS